MRTGSGQRLPIPLARRIKSLAVGTDYSPAQIHREVGEDATTYKTVYRYVTAARERAAAYAEWRMSPEDPEGIALILGLMRRMREMTRERHPRPDAEVASWYVAIVRAYPDAGDEIEIYNLALAAKSGDHESVEEALMYQPWRDRGRELVWASICGIVSGGALDVTATRYSMLRDEFVAALGISQPLTESQGETRQRFDELWERSGRS